MNELESSLHLYQPPLYSGNKGVWRKSFLDAVEDCDDRLTWDTASILSILGFGYVCGDRTLVNEVKQRPWLSKIEQNDEIRLEKIPEHGRLWKSPTRIAEHLRNLLYNEALEVCRDRKEIYVLISGGIDSRIVAGTVAQLYQQDKLATKPVGVTWGMENSRDVAYGQMVAQILGFDWLHINIAPEDVTYNAEKIAISMGSLVSPVHLHKMHWFKNVSKGALVLAGTYGDSIGRAEYSGRHVLELGYLRPVNAFGLIRREVLVSAYKGLMSNLKALHDRSQDQPKYVLCEHEMQAHYLRNMISKTMSTIEQYCSVYQMFTHPHVYSYVWSIHPVKRDDAIYAELLEQLHPQLARLPWARTNQALKGSTVGSRSGLRSEHHAYESWIGGPLFDNLNQYIDPEWFRETGIFDPDKIRKLSIAVRRGNEGEGLYGSIACERWLWLAVFRRMAERLELIGKSTGLDNSALRYSIISVYSETKTKCSAMRRILSRSRFFYSGIRRCLKPFRQIGRCMRRMILEYQTIRRYPPEK